MAKLKLPGKWIDRVQAETRVMDAARRVLKVRLKAVGTALAASEESGADAADVVHQLRVATRRASAAVATFKPWLRQSAARKVRKHLRAIRRAAGEARQCDVHLMMLAGVRAGVDPGLLPAVDYASQRICTARGAAQLRIERAAERFPRKRLRRLGRALVRKAEAVDRDMVSLRAAAAAVLPPLIARLRAAAERDMASLDDLHDLRIKAKRLRYAMEIVAPALDPAFRDELYPRIESLQELMGPINDHHEVAGRLRKYAADIAETSAIEPGDAGTLRARVEQLAARFERERDRGHAAFVRSWQDVEEQRLFARIDALAGGGPPHSSQEAPPPEIHVNGAELPVARLTPAAARSAASVQERRA